MSQSCFGHFLDREKNKWNHPRRWISVVFISRWSAKRHKITLRFLGRDVTFIYFSRLCDVIFIEFFSSTGGPIRRSTALRSQRLVCRFQLLHTVDIHPDTRSRPGSSIAQVCRRSRLRIRQTVLVIPRARCRNHFLSYQLLAQCLEPDQI